MTTSAARPRHPSTSPFERRAEPPIATFECGDLVSHDSHGMGRVTNAEAHAVTVDFGTQQIRIVSPFHKMSVL